MAIKQHSRICLRRITSRSTIDTTDHHSRFCIKGKSRQILDRLRAIIRRPPFPPPFTKKNCFIEVLPPELRLIIYRHALRHKLPLRLKRIPRLPGSSREWLVGILFVNRLIYTEALPIFYQVNCISVARSEFCRYPTGFQPKLTCKLNLTTRILIRDPLPSPRCADRIAYPGRSPCNHCDPNLIDLLNRLRGKPQLRVMKLDYYNSPDQLQPFLRAMQTYNPGFEVTCVRIGRYSLSGPDLRTRLFTLENRALVDIWKLVVKLPHPVPWKQYDRAREKMVRTLCLKWFLWRLDEYSRRDLAMKVASVMEHHDRGKVPRRFLAIWPRGIKMEFRRVDALGQEVMMGFDRVLEEVCAELGEWRWDLVDRP